MEANKKYCLSIAGFDPSGGAGILSDIKTFEAHRMTGFGVCTAITYQTEDQFFDLEWCSKEQIIRQLGPLLERYNIETVKIGLIENHELFLTLLQKLKTHNPNIKVVWDPVLGASTGFVFHKKWNEKTFINCLQLTDLFTPNWPEAKKIGQGTAIENAIALSQHTPVLLKGGHQEGREAIDRLFQGGIAIKEFKTKRIAGKGKHGSGCVLSSAIAVYLARGNNVITACREAKKYVQHFIKSSNDLLGKHEYTII